jgi:flagellar biosynthetic protein FlhB
VSEDQFSKTEAATPHRRDEARRKGQVARSRDVQALGVLLGAVLAFAAGGTKMRDGMLGLAQSAFSRAGDPPGTLADFHDVLVGHAGAGFLVLLPFFAATLLAGVAVSLAQTGFLFSPEALRFRPERLDPFAGLRRLVSVERWFEVGRALLTVALVLAAGWAAVHDRIPHWIELLRVSVPEAALVSAHEASGLAAAVLGALIPLAAVDFAWQRFRYEKQLRMTKQEVKEEARQQEGDPQSRSRRRARHRELSRSRMIAAVAEADVVVTNPTHYAVALRYDPSAASAPEVLAKGKDRVAARIREAALEHGVPLVEDAPLARLLHRSGEVGRPIPEKLFQAVAEVLAYVYRLDPGRARRWRAGV